MYSHVLCWWNPVCDFRCCMDRIVSLQHCRCLHVYRNLTMTYRDSINRGLAQVRLIIMYTVYRFWLFDIGVSAGLINTWTGWDHWWPEINFGVLYDACHLQLSHLFNDEIIRLLYTILKWIICSVTTVIGMTIDDGRWNGHFL